MTEYVFDVKMFAQVRVRAKTEEDARMMLHRLSGVPIDVQIDGEGGESLTVVEASMDDGEQDLIEEIED